MSTRDLVLKRSTNKLKYMKKKVKYWIQPPNEQLFLRLNIGFMERDEKG